MTAREASAKTVMEILDKRMPSHIAIPSMIWCNCFAKYREKNNVSYYKLYCESWANIWGEKFSKMERVDS